ncbi:MAG TPA: CE1759 family FMN reductase [Microbacteriaceae bacterium]|nr:CE1759 family FMN reductase [Microbacteriaceae bacterium]
MKNTDIDKNNFKIVVVNAGSSDPSFTAMLASHSATKTVELLGTDGVSAQTIELKPLAVDIAHALTTGLLSPALEKASDTLGSADAIIASTPVYKAGASALFTGFFQILDDDLLIGKPVVLAATAGTARHSLVIDQELRALFAYLRALVAPTSLFATPEDWGSPELNGRINRAATELALLIKSSFEDKLRSQAWDGYQHSYGSAGGTELSVDLNTDLMKLATGG